MTKQERFEALKADTIKDYTNYINDIKEFSFEDLNDFNKRLSLVDKYHKAVSSNAEFRTFVNSNRLSTVETNNFTPPRKI